VYYLPWLQTLHLGAHGNADIVSHFFRLAFNIVRVKGILGLVATKTIRQGDTRDSGLRAIILQGGVVGRATRRLKWPGEASVVISVLHISKGSYQSPTLDGKPVRRISAYLVEGDFDEAPKQLATNSQKGFHGAFVFGAGFTFDDDAALDGEAESLTTMQSLISKDQRNGERIFPYIGGEEVTSDPRHLHHRYVIDFQDFPLRRDECLPSWSVAHSREQQTWLRDGVVPIDYSGAVAADWPDLLEIVERRVKPHRQRLVDNADGRRRKKFWWLFGRSTVGLNRAKAGLPWIQVNPSKATPHHAIVILSSQYVYSQNLNVFALSGFGAFTALSSRPHEIWARFVGTTMKDDFTYAVRIVLARSHSRQILKATNY
jgi:hypothetical protein